MNGYISISSDNEENSLTHHGVKGMKWGRRKDRRSSSSGVIRKRVSNAKNSISKKASDTKAKVKKTISKIDKDKVKKVAKTSAVIAGKVAVGSLLGYAGVMAFNEITNLRSERAHLLSENENLKSKAFDLWGEANRLGQTASGYKSVADLGTGLAKALDGYDFKGMSKADQEAIKEVIDILKKK